jgi:hypothetical protein
MGLLTPSEIRQRALRLWQSGRVLKAWLGAEPLFPVAWPAGRPSAVRLLQEFAQVRAWIEALEQACQCHRGYGYRIEYDEINHRQLGRQRLPRQILFDQPADLVAYLGKQPELRRFAELARPIRAAHPVLADWIKAQPMRLLEYAEAWPRLLKVLSYFQTHPRPGLYLRELDIPGVDSKFIEAHQGLLADLLDRVLPPDGLDPEVKGMARHGFERRYGLNYEQPLIRLRLLDPRQDPYGGLRDVSVALDCFARLDPPSHRVFVTENKINGLSFPELPDSLIIFGLGYGISSMKDAQWLVQREIYYWGDIDTHGFAILSQLRTYFPHTRSFLMDRATLDHFRELWGEEPEGKRCSAALPNLNDSEQALYRLLREDALGVRVRLEQERIGFGYLRERLKGLAD